MKVISIFILLVIPSFSFAHSVDLGKGIALLVTIPFSGVCLIVAYFISKKAKSPKSFIGLILFSLLSCYPAINVLSDLTFEDEPTLYTVQVALLILWVLPFWILYLFTLKWKKDYSNSAGQTVYDWRKLKKIIGLKLKSNSLTCSIFEKNIGYYANLSFSNGKYILNIYSNETGNKLLVSESKFNSLDCLNLYLTDFTKFRLSDFLN